MAETATEQRDDSADMQALLEEAKSRATAQPAGAAATTERYQSPFPADAAATLMERRRAETGRMTGVIDELTSATRGLMERPIPAPAPPRLHDPPAAPQMPYADAMQVFQNPAVLLVTLGSLFTRTPAINALNAGAAAIEGFRTGNKEAYDLARQQWKDKTEEMLARNRNETERYNAAWKATEHSARERQARLTALATEFQHEKMKNALATGDMDTVYSLMQLQQQANTHLDNVIEKAREADMRIQEMREARDDKRDLRIRELESRERVAGASLEEKRFAREEKNRLELEKLQEYARRTDITAEQKREAQASLDRYHEGILRERATGREYRHEERVSALKSLDAYRLRRLEEDARRTDLTIEQKREAQKALETYRNKSFDERVREFDQTMDLRRKSLEETVKFRDAQRQDKADWNKLSDDGLRFMVQQYLAGDKSVLTNIGRGRQSAENIARFREMVPEEAAKIGMSPTDVAKRMQEYQATTAAMRSFEIRGANVEFAANAAKETMKLAVDASHNVTRGNLVPWNMVMQAIRTGTSDPNMLQFVNANEAVISEYAAVLGRGNPITTVHLRQRAENMLNTTTSHRAYLAGLAQLTKEIEAVRGARDNTRDDLVNRIMRTPSAAGAATAPPSARGTPGAGVIRYDAEGNRLQ